MRAELDLLHATLEGSPDGILVLDEDGAVAFHNRRFAEMWGLSPDELSGDAAMAALERVTAQLVDGAAFVPRTEGLWRGGHDGAPHDLALVDGRVFEVRTAPLARGDGRGRVVTLRDVTATRKEEEIARRTAASFTELIERCPDGVLVSRRWRVLHVNPPMVALLGYGGKDELLGAPTTSLWPSVDVPVIASRVKELYVRAGDASLEARRFRRKDGSTVEVEVAALAIDWEGEPAMLIMARDISERERLIARLVESDRLAALGALAASVSHEVNNPLACVLGNLNALVRTHGAVSRAVTEEQLGREAFAQLSAAGEMLGLAQEAADRVRAFVAALRTFSRGDDDAQLCDVGQTLEAALHVARAEIASRADLVLDIGELPLVRASQGRLAQLFVQVVLRAARSFPAESRGDAHITVRGITTPEGDAVIEVSDDGPGLAGSAHARLGSWPDPSALLVADGIATSLRGSLEVRSSDRETVVVVTLPPAFAEEDSTGKRSSVRPARLPARDDAS